MLERFDGLAYLADENRPLAGATGDRTQTLATSGFPWSAFLIALKPGQPTSTYWISAVSGSYTINGTTVITGRGLLALSGSYTITGSTVMLLKNGKGIRGTSGSYAITGSPATLRYSASAAGGMSVWSGSAWVDKPVKVWSGSAWVAKSVKVWNGSAWV
jgi:hypothetical protein